LMILMLNMLFLKVFDLMIYLRILESG
jgi:hypothetical protein